ncbi:hypothetical protein CWE09_00820 [Aliidiomarina minuta]|uniref:Glucose-inhibited division protein B n=1 Tax=Aliidiomarina minuta TaxID=880057 RepID=A0A432W5J9_9GAMM|nr:hypothetical protein [Aliidiomarina minuta]RUO25311.1 hypothetical protein CWE09_00820 [Aliidiomarina minuta]
MQNLILNKTGKVVLPVSLLLLLAACSGATEVSLANLVNQEYSLDGRTVLTKGVVRTFEEPRHYWIEDEQLNRVSIEPDAAVRDLVGERVEVSGRFTVSREQGRVIQAQRVTLLSN